jgi:hypothetical protein
VCLVPEVEGSCPSENIAVLMAYGAGMGVAVGVAMAFLAVLSSY